MVCLLFIFEWPLLSLVDLKEKLRGFSHDIFKNFQWLYDTYIFFTLVSLFSVSLSDVNGEAEEVSKRNWTSV